MIRHIKNITSPIVRPVVAVGNFDGVHQGHISLLKALQRMAKSVDGESVVVTFDPHPQVAMGKAGTQLLSDPAEKMELMEKAGVDHLLLLDFNDDFSRQSACDFIKDYLIDQIGINILFLGYDSRFGWKAEGNHDIIEACAQKFGIRVEKAGPEITDDYTISSSLIRRLISEGNISEGNRILGYDYQLSGTVIGGKRIGRELGFPTANVEPLYQWKLIPGDGVYAVNVIVGGLRLPGMLNIGRRPTVDSSGGARTIEVHIINFTSDIYGENIRIIFRERLRDEMKFSSLEQLVEQLSIDRVNALRVLG